MPRICRIYQSSSKIPASMSANESSNRTVVFRFLVRILQVSCLFNVTYCQISTWTFVVSVQGNNKCPDTSLPGSKVVLARSQLDCSRRCCAMLDCHHHCYHANNRTCYLFHSTPTSLVTATGCKFMSTPEQFRGCFPQASPSNDCSIPFQYGNKQYEQCITDPTNTIFQCVRSNGQLTDCVAPVGFSATQSIVNVTLGAAAAAPSTTAAVARPVHLPCIGNWIIAMHRFDGSVNFDLVWSDYKKGFGTIGTSEYWIGNDNLHLYTSQPATSYTLRVEVLTKTGDQWFYAEYTSFYIDSEANKYAIHVSGYSGNAGDSLSNTQIATKWNHNGMKFSTSDSDNDLQSGGSCAITYSGPWWHNNCWYCCLFCPYSSPNFSWYTLNDLGLESNGALRDARMLIRKV